jgi:prepilin-type N-terminal cleavage/methylation domain-containing protein
MKTRTKSSAELGFSLLELMVSIAIIATIITFTVPNFQNWSVKRSYKNTLEDLEYFLSESRNEVFTRNSTIRVSVSQSGDSYSFTRFISATPTTTCSSAGSWTEIVTRVISVNSRFQITGDSIGTNLCFFRDGSSSGGEYIISQKDGGEDMGGATLAITIATGFIDSSE